MRGFEMYILKYVMGVGYIDAEGVTLSYKRGLVQEKIDNIDEEHFRDQLSHINENYGSKTLIEISLSRLLVYLISKAIEDKFSPIPSSLIIPVLDSLEEGICKDNIIRACEESKIDELISKMSKIKDILNYLIQLDKSKDIDALYDSFDKEFSWYENILSPWAIIDTIFRKRPDHWDVNMCTVIVFT